MDIIVLNGILQNFTRMSEPAVEIIILKAH